MKKYSVNGRICLNSVCVILILSFSFLCLFLSCATVSTQTNISKSKDEIIFVFDNFENKNYDNWKIEGTAFGAAPHNGPSPKQQGINGFLGMGLVNSFYPDDKAEGKLISKSFRIDKKYVIFLLGGGNHPNETCVNLVIDDKVVLSQTGADNESLKPVIWNISEFKNKDAHIEIVDSSREAWGHINVDQIIFADTIPSEEYFLGYKPLLKAGKFEKIYDPSVGEKEQWYINDHTFIYGTDKKWHLYGITHQEPANPLDEDNFAHAVSDELNKNTWKKLPYVLSVENEKYGETHLWAPHVISSEDKYYMFYCGGGKADPAYSINLAVSTDLNTWTRYEKNPLFTDGCYVRDPFIFKLGDKFVMYYTATDPDDGGNHVVAYRTSDDLLSWSEKKVCFRDITSGCCCGETESPTVIQRGKYFYLFIGPRGGYLGTDIFVSDDPFNFNIEDKAGHIESHALEVICDLDGKWYVSSCGWGQGGVYLAPLMWMD